MTILQITKQQLKGAMFGLLFLTSFLLQAQDAELSLIHVQVPDTVVLGDTITVSAYLKNNTDSEYSNDNLKLGLYVNEIQDADKSPVIQNESLETTINIPSADSVLVEQEVVVDELLFQIGENQDIQKNIIIIWPVDDNYSINYHIQPVVALKQAPPAAIYNASSNFNDVDITDAELPMDAQDLIGAEYAEYTIAENKQQNFNDGSIQFEVKLKNGEDEEVTLYFSEEGILVLIETEFDPNNLSMTIKDAVFTEYSSILYFIESAYELSFSDGTIQYKVEVKDFADTEEYELYFEASGIEITEPGIVVELYEDPDIELGGVNLPNSLELDTEVSVEGTLTNNLAVAYNDVPVPINYMAIPFPPTLVDSKSRTQATTIDVIEPAETKSFQQNLSIDEDLFYTGKNIFIVWPTDKLSNLTANCITQEVNVIVVRDTVGIETIPALSSEVAIAPNPTVQHLSIQTNQLEIEEITVYNLAAKPVANYSDIRQSKFSADISHLNNGMYLLYIQTNQGNAVKKLIVGH